MHRYFDNLHKAAMHLGRWKRVKLDRPHLPIHLYVSIFFVLVLAAVN